MLCDVCHKSIATVHLTEIVNGNAVEMHICQSCATHKVEELKGQMNLAQLLGGLGPAIPAPRAKKEISLTCPACGLTFKEFNKNGKLGCEQCYEIFKQQLVPFIKKIHLSLPHTGKIPGQATLGPDSHAGLAKLKEQLSRAIQMEEYEEAARLRDEIKKVEH